MRCTQRHLTTSSLAPWWWLHSLRIARYDYFGHLEYHAIEFYDIEVTYPRHVLREVRTF